MKYNSTFVEESFLGRAPYLGSATLDNTALHSLASTTCASDKQPYMHHCGDQKPFKHKVHINSQELEVCSNRS